VPAGEILRARAEYYHFCEQPPVRAAGEGPGPVEVRVSEEGGGQLAVVATARAVGPYELRVWVDGPNGAEAVDSPLSMEVSAGEVAQRCCSFTLEVLPTPCVTNAAAN
jgi:hypothetical protein